MAKSAFLAALLATTIAAPAFAAAEPLPADVAADVAAMREEIAALRAEVAELKAVRNVPAAVPATATAAAAPKSSPHGGGGVTFKPFGRLQYDVGFVESPPGVADRGLGFGNEVRRARLGAEGSTGRLRLQDRSRFRQ